MHYFPPSLEYSHSPVQYKEPKHSQNNLLEHSQSDACVHANTNTRMLHACTHVRMRPHTHTRDQQDTLKLHLPAAKSLMSSGLFSRVSL